MPNPAPPTTNALSREDILRLGQAGRPWEFLPVAAQAIDQEPGDLAVRFLASASLARLGLRTLALEQLEAMPAEAQAHPDILGLLKALRSLPEDRLSHDQLRATCEANVAALARRGRDLVGALQTWDPFKAGEAFRALDGNIIRRSGASKRLSSCNLIDHQGAATRLLQSAGNLSRPARIILEGLNPPWVFKKVYEATPAQALGFRQPILIHQPDITPLLDAISLADLTPLLSDERVQVFCGPDSAAELKAHLLSRIEFQSSSLYLPLPAPSPRHSPAVQSVIEHVLGAQESEFQRLRTRVQALYATRDERWWARRYREAAAGGEPLRVLIPTCRYSTFIKHSSADLCATLGRQGHIAELYHEPDDMTRLCGVGYLRTIDRFQPDLVILINFPRASMGGAMPANIPFVCWIQDSMPHLYDAAVGAAQGPLDFLIGHTFVELFEKYGYPTQRAMPISVVADEAKFHRAPARAPSNQEPPADVAFVSHHSETPEAMHQRLCREGAGAPAIVRTFERLYPDIQQAVANASDAPALLHIQNAVTARLREVLGELPDQRTQSLVLRQYAGPLADRMLRHQTLAWAVAVAQRRNWRLRIHGRGWDQHPTFAPFARPELPHGEALRASYQSAVAHLHISSSTLTHQRVIECYLSGGLCLCRLHRDAISNARINAHMALLQRPPDVVDQSNGQTGYTIADHPEAMALANAVGAAGHPYDGPTLWFTQARALSYRRFSSIMPRDQDPTFLLRDLSETTFSSELELERLLARAVHSPSWRSAVIDMVASRARKHLTHDALARRTLDLVRTSLGGQALREAV